MLQREEKKSDISEETKKGRQLLGKYYRAMIAVIASQIVIELQGLWRGISAY